MGTGGMSDGLQTRHTAHFLWTRSPWSLLGVWGHGGGRRHHEQLPLHSWRSKVLQSSVTHHKGLEEVSRKRGMLSSALPLPVLPALPSADSVLQQPRRKILFAFL